MSVSVYIIAEAGSCHDGDFIKATNLVRAAKDSGADAVKFQYWSDPDRLAERRRVPDHYKRIYRTYRLPGAWLSDLWRYAGELGLDFMCTAYLPEDVAAVEPWVRHFKVASFEAEAGDLLRAHEPHLHTRPDRWLVISCGMGAKWEESLGVLDKVLLGRLGDRLKLLHCVSAYPAPAEALGLGSIRKYEYDGYSDHSEPSLTWTGALAVAAGAEVLEAHLRLHETDAENPDAPHAMVPAEFRSYVRHVRFAEACMGDGRHRMQPCEGMMATYKVVTK